MSIFKVHIKQENRTVSIRFTGEFPCKWRGKGLLFTASNGVQIKSMRLPELRTTTTYILYTPGNNHEADRCQHSETYSSYKEASEGYAALVQAVTEWSQYRGIHSQELW